MLLVGRFLYRFVVGFDEQCFWRMNLEAASGNVALQLLLLKVNTIVPKQYQLHLRAIFCKDMVEVGSDQLQICPFFYIFGKASGLKQSP